jgi:hypothetical protein
MNAYTTTTSALRPESTNTLARLLQAIRSTLRRAFELAGEPYKSGQIAPM